MRLIFNRMLLKWLCFSLLSSPLYSQNQTETLTPVVPENLPFTLSIDLAPFLLPTGLQAYAFAIYKENWILIAGRTNGLHGFNNGGNNFPPLFQNNTVYVIDPRTGASYSRSLSESGLSQFIIDTLTVTAPEFFQIQEILYVVGGYGVNSATGEMETKSTLTAINLQGLLGWVMGNVPDLTSTVRQVSHPILQVTGGVLFQNNDHQPFLLVMGQNFQGLYTPSSEGIYTQQVRSFWLHDNGRNLTIFPNPSQKIFPDYRRRDLNVVPILSHNREAYMAFSGVFTLESGVWTVPVTIFPDGSSFEPDPSAQKTFKQAMNQYFCPTIPLYSTKSQDMYIVFPGGLSYGFFSGGVFQTDPEIPFINQVTTVKIDKDQNFTQYLMNNEYPVIISMGSNPGNQLLFGAEARFFPASNIPRYRNHVLQLDQLTGPVVIGYIVGGIMSTLPNTNVPSDSTSSPYVFAVTLVPR